MRSKRKSARSKPEAAKGLPKAESRKPTKAKSPKASTRSPENKQKSPLQKRKATGPKIKRHQLPKGNPVRAKPVVVKREEKVAFKIPPVLLHRSFDQSSRAQPELNVTSGAKAARSPIAPRNRKADCRVWLVARDPNCLYVAWELDSRKQSEYNRISRDGHLIVRIFLGTAPGESVAEIHVHPDSSNWFVQVPRGGVQYRASLGFYSKQETWVHLARSAPERTPTFSEVRKKEETRIKPPPEPEVAAKPQRIHEELRPDNELEPTPSSEETSPDAKPASMEPEPQGSRQDETLVPRVDEVDTEPTSEAPAAPPTKTESPCDAQIETGTERLTPSSLDLAAPLLEDFGVDLASGSLTTFPPQQSSFWFNVDADLIIHGATEPNAKVTLGGQAVELRPDGSFSVRISLPDGQHAIPAEATSADGTKSKKIDLWFQRATKT